LFLKFTSFTLISVVNRFFKLFPVKVSIIFGNTIADSIIIPNKNEVVLLTISAWKKLKLNNKVTLVRAIPRMDNTVAIKNAT